MKGQNVTILIKDACNTNCHCNPTFFFYSSCDVTIAWYFPFPLLYDDEKNWIPWVITYTSLWYVIQPYLMSEHNFCLLLSDSKTARLHVLGRLLQHLNKDTSFWHVLLIMLCNYIFGCLMYLVRVQNQERNYTKENISYMTWSSVFCHYTQTSCEQNHSTQPSLGHIDKDCKNNYVDGLILSTLLWKDYQVYMYCNNLRYCVLCQGCR